jgi:SAM-dependent methyltransferase
MDIRPRLAGIRPRPYPVAIKRRAVETEGVPLGGGVEDFDTPEALEINRARLAHLDSLGLPIEGKIVLDVGCGVGHLAQFFVSKGCKVVAVDGRPENIVRLHGLYPSLEAHVADVETEPLRQFGTFDIVFAYGLLYHLENPLSALRNMESVCRDILLLETMVCDHCLPILRIDDETLSFSQGLRGLGCRPSPSYVVLALDRVGFDFVYAPKEPPKHTDFHFRWKNNCDWSRDGHPLRCVFLGSRCELQNPHLIGLL